MRIGYDKRDKESKHLLHLKSFCGRNRHVHRAAVAWGSSCQIFWSQDSFMLSKIIEDPKELLFMLFISIYVYLIRN